MVKPLKIAIASGKGGTGKTTLSVALAQVAALDQRVSYLDCDVEEPNGGIFINPTISQTERITVKVPTLEAERCQGCGKCSEICQFSAIVTISKKALIFPEMCHNCGGCVLVCPNNALTEVPHEIGSLNIGEHGNIQVVEGLLDIGNAMAPPIIKAVKNFKTESEVKIFDAPPGTSCPMVSTISEVDFVILVTEPTPFGLNDLKLAVETVRVLEIPFGIVINRSDIGDQKVVEYCQTEGLNLLLEIPSSRQIAEAYSRGESIYSAEPNLKNEFKKLLDQIAEVVK